MPPFLEPIWSYLPQAPGGAIPPASTDLCFHLFCVRPFGAISNNFDPKVLKMAQNRVKIGQNLLKMGHFEPFWAILSHFESFSAKFDLF